MMTNETTIFTKENEPLTVLSFGGGQDSTALLYKYVYDSAWRDVVSV